MRYKGDIKTIVNNLYQDAKDNKYDFKKNYELKIDEIKGNRSTLANAYYWRMLRDLAKAMRIGQTEMHNRILGIYGELELDKDNTPNTELHKIGYDYLKDTRKHLKPTGSMVKTPDGDKEIFYVLKESKYFNTQQFSELIDTLKNEIISSGLDNVVDIRE